MKTVKEQINEIHTILNKNTDYVGSKGLLHVEVQISFLNMLNLVFKFMIAVVVVSPFAAAFLYTVYMSFKSMMGNM